jgi:hypothetical protein
MPRNNCKLTPVKITGPGSSPHDGKGITGFPDGGCLLVKGVPDALGVLTRVFCGNSGTRLTPGDARRDPFLPAGGVWITPPPFLHDPGGFP